MEQARLPDRLETERLMLRVRKHTYVNRYHRVIYELLRSDRRGKNEFDY